MVEAAVFDFPAFYRAFIHKYKNLAQYRVFSVLFDGEDAAEYWRVRSTNILHGNETVSQDYRNRIEQLNESELEQRFQRIITRELSSRLNSIRFKPVDIQLLLTIDDQDYTWEPSFARYVKNRIAEGDAESRPYGLLVDIFKLSLNILPHRYVESLGTGNSQSEPYHNHFLQNPYTDKGTFAFFCWMKDEAKYHGGIKELDILSHSGLNFWRGLNSQMRNVQKIICDPSFPTRVLLNDEKSVSSFLHGLKVEDEDYPTLDYCVRLWQNRTQKYNSIELKVCTYPILHRVYLVQFEDGSGATNIRLYMYGLRPAQASNDARLIYTSNDPQFDLFRKEFNLLWIGVKVDQYCEPTGEKISLTYEEWKDSIKTQKPGTS